jgi:hypothetical protein
VCGNICRSRLSAIGERTLLRPHANSTACGVRTRDGVSTRYSSIVLGMPRLRNHAAPFPIIPHLSSAARRSA